MGENVKEPTVVFKREVPDTKIIGQTKQGRPLHLLQEHVRYCINGQVLDIKPGYVTDFGSIPRFAWPFFLPSEPKLIPCYILHDFCYGAELFPIEINDRLFLGAMRHAQVKGWRRFLVFVSVRALGWATYKEHTEYSIASNRKYAGIFMSGEIKRPLWDYCGINY